MKFIIAIIQPNRLEDVKAALTEVEVFRLTVMDVSPEFLAVARSTATARGLVVTWEERGTPGPHATAPLIREIRAIRGLVAVRVRPRISLPLAPSLEPIPGLGGL